MSLAVHGAGGGLACAHLTIPTIGSARAASRETCFWICIFNTSCGCTGLLGGSPAAAVRLGRGRRTDGEIAERVGGHCARVLGGNRVADVKALRQRRLKRL